MLEQPNNNEFAVLFKKFRLRSEIESLSEFCNLFADEGMIYENSLFTRWQKGERVPRDRRVVLTMIKLFVKRGGINSADEANTLLESLDLRDLTNKEIDEIQSIFASVPKLSNSLQDGFIYSRYSVYFGELLYGLWRKLSRRHTELFLIYMFISFSLYWIVSRKNFNRYIGDFPSTYFIIALFGGLYGLSMLKNSGGRKTFLDKAIMMFSLGLFGQVFGQIVYTYYFYNNYFIAYPSLGDVGYFGTIPLYILGVFYLARALGVKMVLRSYAQAISAISIPILLLTITYIHLLQDYTFEWSNLLRILLDFGYPLGQSIYISLAILTLSLSRGIFGGMKNKIRFLIFALFVQYLSDYTFIYLAHEGIITAGTFNDYLYCLSYFLMSLALLQFNTVPRNLYKR